MKKVLSILLGLTILFTSCDKKSSTVVPSETPYLKYDFLVSEQESVNRYEIEISTDGSSYETVGLVMATTNMQEKYSITLNVGKYKNNGKIYSRIKSIDIDGKFLYSKISVNSFSNK